MHEKIGLRCSIQRRVKRGDQRVGQVTDESDCIGDDHVPDTVKPELARGGIECRE